MHMYRNMQDKTGEWKKGREMGRRVREGGENRKESDVIHVNCICISVLKYDGTTHHNFHTITLASVQIG